MVKRLHHYRVTVEWTGNRGQGTETYAGYARDYIIRASGKALIEGSSDPAFRGDAERWNPEEMLLASLSTCHKLWYLHLCSTAGISVLTYLDHAEATMQEDPDGSGRFISAVLHPRATVRTRDDRDTAIRLHEQAHRFCFVANSVNFPVSCEPEVTQADP